MADGPPPTGGVSIKNNLNVKLNQLKMLKNKNEGEKFLIMTRADEKKDMSAVSPFLLKKVIQTVGGDVIKCIKLRNGTVLIQTKDTKQAEKIIKIINLNDNISVSVEEHNSLNEAKGIIYCPELQYISDEEFLSEMENQNVVELRRFKKKDGDNVRETGLYCLKFSLSKIPNEVYIGYQKYYVRQFIPLPLRCMNCLNFNHIAEKCKKEKMCNNCGEVYHLKNENEKCTKPEKCCNCKEAHNAFDKRCPKFLKEKEIKSIKIKENVDIKEAVKRYNQRFPFSTTFSKIGEINMKKNCGCKCNCNNNNNNNKPEIVKNLNQENLGKIKTNIEPTDFKFNSNISLNTQNTKTLENGNIVIAKNLSKKKKRELKKNITQINKKIKTLKNNNKTCLDSSFSSLDNFSDIPDDNDSTKYNTMEC